MHAPSPEFMNAPQNPAGQRKGEQKRVIWIFSSE